MSKRGQVTIFIVIALVIIAMIALYLIITGKLGAGSIDGVPTSTENPQYYISRCAIDAIDEAINIMLPRGGYLEPTLNKKYNDDNIALLCYTANNYEKCINQNPLYIKHLEDEIKTYITPKINECFSNLKREYDSKGITNDISETMEVRVSLVEGKAIAMINRELIIIQKGETKEYKEFKASALTPLYQMARVAEEIVNQEARFCYSEYLGYMMLYPWVKITKLDINSEFKLYFIEDKASGKKLNIALRGCALPGTF